ncbi:MAG: transcriptional repressor [Actinomycetaceae bacterium]|nr:transcriptional repressor [Actinomycetaceae bacterium]
MQRRTKQRSAVLEILNNVDGFHSAQELHTLLRDSGYSVGLATVYRNLELLSTKGEIDVIRSEDGEALYRRCDEQLHHHHLVCRECGRTEDLESQEVEQWVESVAKKYKFTDVAHSADLFGLCEECSGQ